jgi:GT2 family glycosyltransferase
VAQSTSSEWLVVANADTRVEPGTLSALLAGGRDDTGAGIVAPQLVLDDGSTQHSIHAFPGIASTAAFNFGLGRVSPRLADRLALEDRWDVHTARVVDWAHGAFLLVRRAAFDAIGGFDPQQFLYAEDLDIAWRMSQAGWHTRYLPDAIVHHVRSAAIAQLWGDDRDFRAQRSAYAWMLRRRGVVFMRTVALLNTIGAALRAALATPRGMLAGGDAGLHAWQLRRHTRIHLDGLLADSAVLRKHR